MPNKKIFATIFFAFSKYFSVLIVFVGIHITSAFTIPHSIHIFLSPSYYTRRNQLKKYVFFRTTSKAYCLIPILWSPVKLE